MSDTPISGSLPGNSRPEIPDGMDVEVGDDKSLEAAKLKEQAKVVSQMTQGMVSEVKILTDAPAKINTGGES